MRDFGLPEGRRHVPAAGIDPPVPAAPAAAGDDSVWRRPPGPVQGPSAGECAGHAEHGLRRAGRRLPHRAVPRRLHPEAAGQAGILTVLRDVTAAELGRDIRVMLAVGKAPPASGRSVPSPPPSRQAPQPAPQAAAPAPPANDPPPWSLPPPPAALGLDELAQNGRQLDNFKIK